MLECAALFAQLDRKSTLKTELVFSTVKSDHMKALLQNAFPATKLASLATEDSLLIAFSAQKAEFTKQELVWMSVRTVIILI